MRTPSDIPLSHYENGDGYHPPIAELEELTLTYCPVERGHEGRTLTLRRAARGARWDQVPGRAAARVAPAVRRRPGRRRFAPQEPLRFAALSTPRNWPPAGARVGIGGELDAKRPGPPAKRLVLGELDEGLTLPIPIRRDAEEEADGIRRLNAAFGACSGEHIDAS